MIDDFWLSLISFTLSSVSIVLYQHRKKKSTSITTISCPGKVLICGGYLILDRLFFYSISYYLRNIYRQYDGVTIAASSARFYTSILPLLYKTGALQNEYNKLHIVVDSPQFYKTFEYYYEYGSITNCDNDRLIPHCLEDRNIFVEKCLSLCLSFILSSPLGSFHKLINRKLKINENSKQLFSLGITLQANNDFYSQTKELQKRGLPLLSQSLKTLPDFMPCPKGNNIIIILLLLLLCRCFR